MAIPSLSEAPAFPLGQSVATAIAWRFRGELRVTAIVKVTFAFSAVGGTMARVAPQAIATADVHQGRNPTRSVRVPSDLAPYRRRADVVFTGHAHAPEGAVASSRVRFGLSDGARALFDKSLLVRKKGGFKKIPLDYEHAFGGYGHPDNPFGEGFEDEASEDLNVLDPVDHRRTAGFAPISARMSPRSASIGSLPLPSFGREVVTIPDTLDFDAFQAAPVDQRVDFLRGDEWILLEGLHPSHPRLHMKLPGARGVARLHGLSSAGIADGKPLAMYADALHVIGDEERCTLVYRGSLAIANEAALSGLCVAAGVEIGGEPLTWPTLEELAQRKGPTGSPVSRPADAGATISLSDADIVSEEPADATIALGAILGTIGAPAKGAITMGPDSAPELPRDPLPFKAGLAHVDIRTPTPKAAKPAGSDGATLPVAEGATKPRSALPFEIQKLLTPAAKAPSAGAARPAAARPKGDATLAIPDASPGRPAGAKPSLPFKQGVADPSIAAPSRQPKDRAGSGSTLPITDAPTGRALPFGKAAKPAPLPDSTPPVADSPPAVSPSPAGIEPPPAEIKPPPQEARAADRVVHVETAPPRVEPRPEPPKKALIPPKVNVRNVLYGARKDKK